MAKVRWRFEWRASFLHLALSILYDWTAGVLNRANRGGYQIGRDQLTWAGPLLPHSLEPTGTCQHNREPRVSANGRTIRQNKYRKVVILWLSVKQAAQPMLQSRLLDPKSPARRQKWIRYGEDGRKTQDWQGAYHVTACLVTLPPF
ncbi:hypothetical protein F1880_003692 [Penicillium rolfsii]|nr:hypothetical protein F1880_003692 [Penicillium rolfsii]